MLELVQTSYNADYMAHWSEHIGAMLPEQTIASYVNFLALRGQHVLYDAGDAVTKLVPPVDFAITTNGGTDVVVSDGEIVLEGVGWVDVAAVVRVDGDAEIPLTLTWTGSTTWESPLALSEGVNVVVVQARDRHGASLAEDTITVTIAPSPP